MKKISVFIGVNLWLIFLFISVSAQDFKTVRDGIEYAEMTREIDKLPVKINLLRLDLTKARLDVVHAMDAAIGLEKTSSIATRHGAFAAINAGFFRIDKSIYEGDDTGVLQINRELYSESYSGRVALLIANANEQTKVSIERSNISDLITIKGKNFEAGRNRERKENDLVVFTNAFHQTTLTDGNGTEFLLRNNKIVQVFDRKGNSKIPCDGYILSATGKMREQLLVLLKLGTKIKLFGTHSSPTDSLLQNSMYSQSEDVVSGVPQLIKDGKIEITWEQEKSSKSFVETKHPRTAVAKLKDGKFLMVTVDGRSEASGGIGLEDLAKILLELGATDAMNLDGGGSSTMFLDGKIVNHPSDKEGERKIGDAILVFSRSRKQK